ncbi:MAG: hypothetical protein AAGF23_18970 [Acidobacteriota bacterium]
MVALLVGPHLLDGDVPAEPSIAGAIHAAHAPLPDHRKQSIRSHVFLDVFADVPAALPRLRHVPPSRLNRAVSGVL